MKDIVAAWIEHNCQHTKLAITQEEPKKALFDLFKLYKKKTSLNAKSFRSFLKKFRAFSIRFKI